MNDTRKHLDLFTTLTKIEERNIEQAKYELSVAQAALALAKNNDIGNAWNIGDLTVSFAQNDWLIPALKLQIKEIRKYLNKKPNTWE